MPVGLPDRRRRGPPQGVDTRGYNWLDAPADLARAFGRAGKAGLTGYATALTGVDDEGRTVGNMLPVARDERTGDVSLAAPRILDLWNTVGGSVPARGITLGAGPVIARKALKHYGRTFNPREAGYILDEGELVDFSGRHWGRGSETMLGPAQRNVPMAGHRDYYANQRNVDHREVAEVFDDTIGNEDALTQFMSEGQAVRFGPEGGMASATQVPTGKQVDALIRAHKRAQQSSGAPLYLDAVDPNTGQPIASGAIEKPTSDKVRAFFADAFGDQSAADEALDMSQEALPDTIARLLREGRASEVTDDMLGALTPSQNRRLVELYESGATGAPMPMDEASRMARARAMGANTEPTTYPRNDPALDAEAKRLWDEWGAANKAVRDDVAAKREAVGGLSAREAQRVALQEIDEKKLAPRDFEERILELRGYGVEVSPSAEIEAAAREAERAYKAAKDAQNVTPPGADYHGSPDISWLADRSANFDPARTHDLNLAYGQSRAYTSRDPRAASGYARQGASWGNRDVEGAAPGVVPLQVLTKRPFDMDARFTPEQARKILGDAFDELPDEDFFTGREVWQALVEDQPSYGDLRIESQLIGGDVGDMLPKTQANAELADMGYDALQHVDRYNPGRGGKHNVTIPFDNAAIRSRHARFDPRLRNNADLLAARTAPGAGIGLGDPNRRRRLTYRDIEDML